jgi:hypothetical protein
MKRTHITLALAALTIALSGAELAAQSPQTHALTVVELFQSEGCSDCSPAEANLNALAGRADILALSFEVTYWDQLGWKDRYARPEFTQRQWDYARVWRNANVYTPQMVVNGRYALVGSNRAQVDNAIAHTPALSSVVTVSHVGRTITVSGPKAGGETIVQLVNYDPRVINQPVRAGENAGATLPHKNIVTGITKLGVFDGGTARFSATAPAANTAQAILVQQGVGGPIIAAAKI